MPITRATIRGMPITRETTRATIRGMPITRGTTRATIRGMSITRGTTRATIRGMPTTRGTTMATIRGMPITRGTTMATIRGMPITRGTTRAIMGKMPITSMIGDKAFHGAIKVTSLGTGSLIIVVAQLIMNTKRNMLYLTEVTMDTRRWFGSRRSLSDVIAIVGKLIYKYSGIVCAEPQIYFLSLTFQIL